MLKPYGFTEWSDVVDLLTAQSGKQLFSKTHRLVKDRNELILAKIDTNTVDDIAIEIQKYDTEISNPVHLIFKSVDNDILSDSQSIIVDKKLLKYPLQVRKWRFGDYICPIGMTGRKKLSQLFKDKKLSLLEKENIWLLTDAKDQIIWVIGMRQDRRFSVLPSTTQRIKISYKS